MTHYGVRAHIESTWPEHRFSTPEIEIIGADRPNQSTSSCYGNSKPTRNRVPKNNQKRLRDTVSLDAHLRHHPISPYQKHHFREDTLIPGEQAVAPDQLNFSTSPRQHIPAKITHNSDPAKRLQTGTPLRNHQARNHRSDHSDLSSSSSQHLWCTAFVVSFEEGIEGYPPFELFCYFENR